MKRLDDFGSPAGGEAAPSSDGQRLGVFGRLVTRWRNWLAWANGHDEHNCAHSSPECYMCMLDRMARDYP